MTGPSTPTPPIPRTRVHRVDSLSCYGEVPGTLAFTKRLQDAQPDEMIVPDEPNPWAEGTLSPPPEGAKSPSPKVPITLVEEVHGGPGSGAVTPNHHQHHNAADAMPDLTTDRTLEEKRIEEEIERESGLHAEVVNAKLLEHAASTGQTLTVPSSPEIKAVDEEDISTANAHTPELDLDRADSPSPPKRQRTASLSAPRSPELRTVDLGAITSANTHIPSDPRKPRSPRISISLETRPSEVERLDLHAPVEEGHLEAPHTPDIEKLDEFDIKSSNIAASDEPVKMRARSPSLKVTRAPNEVIPPPAMKEQDHSHLEAPLSPDLKGVDPADIHTTNVSASPERSRPTSPSLLVTDHDATKLPEFSLGAPTISVDADTDMFDGINPTPPHPAALTTCSNPPSPTTPRIRRRSSASSIRSGRSLRSKPSQQALKSPTLAPPGFVGDGQNEEEVEEEDWGEGSDFGDFDDFEDAPTAEADDETNFFTTTTTTTTTPPPPPPQPQLPFPVPDFDDHDTAKIHIHTLVNTIFPPTPDASPKQENEKTNPFSTRSHLFWTQLSQPPKLEPMNWKLSRVRRLFLLSLGIPIDLDEILPATTQKKLILSSINTANGGHGGAKTSLPRHMKGGSSTDLPGSAPASQTTHRKTSTPPPVDMQLARSLAGTSDVRLQGMSTKELRQMVDDMQTLMREVQGLREYWEREREKKVGEKEAFEGVIEGIVGWARKVRGKGK
ncbi:hypothetical protein BJ508DRAFT_378462 [Ascobolus immersus RN42]|uniref:Uncharacterized protein n=1 Tax=Ascobolus immersus RN42 TaxID=1160509 RepID=A0A3N4HY88_ASCIM|nr:hypothetical protein BJ508DRAFT_378462 [Ascobolus immersus RN42]